ncbi:MAG TPA: hypothetical protein VJT49_17370 [Amycolatopsis sp.]|uniref:hypothetical protein n=1 Tax=Amycolatopsis sp. TaxID=37632 RepID=UPI002B49C4F9|nr:hypothetical protein [Amycolatopsis sp.]HKS46843.1 hypothetical protein [Amycolatopsis sp.]
MVRKDHAEKVRVGSKIESGSILDEDGAAFGVCAGQDGACARRSGLHQALDAVSEVVSGDVLGVDVELGEDDLRHSPLYRVAASAGEGLRVRQEREGGREELLPLVQLARRVGELSLDLSTLTFDVGELLLDLRSGPLGVVKQVEQAVFLGLQLVQPGVHTLLEAAEMALLQEEGVIELTAYRSLKAISESHRAQVGVHCRFDLGDGEVRQVAQVLLTASAFCVSVPFCGGGPHAPPGPDPHRLVPGVVVGSRWRGGTCRLKSIVDCRGCDHDRSTVIRTNPAGLGQLDYATSTCHAGSVTRRVSPPWAQRRKKVPDGPGKPCKCRP